MVNISKIYLDLQFKKLKIKFLKKNKLFLPNN